MKLAIKNGVCDAALKMRTLQKSNQISIGIQNIDIMLDFALKRQFYQVKKLKFAV